MPEEMGGVGLADAVETGAETEIVETGDIGTETGAETGGEVESSEQTPEITPKPAKGKLNLSEVVKKSGEALKAIDPALPAAMRTAAFELGGLYREFPGGLREAVATKQAFDAIGGESGAKELQEAIADYGSFE